ncbi:hypothetical protein AB0N05_12255 [Nocardia sp. NPDC051030]|uniref:hypothetical protein n=1 Tax=Nocardia sp. NPDC051030 TaxID=3155162 RepID=UPI0034401279
MNHRPYPYARRTADGAIRIPKPVYGPGDIVGSGHEDVQPGDPRFEELDRILRQWDSDPKNIIPDSERVDPQSPSGVRAVLGRWSSGIRRK